MFEEKEEAANTAKLSGCEISAAQLASMRLYWETANWHAIMALPVPTDSKPSKAKVEALLYRMEAAFHTGETEQGQAIVTRLAEAGVEKQRLAATLLGGALEAMARGWMILGRDENAGAAFELASALSNSDDYDSVAAIATLRRHHEALHIEASTGLRLQKRPESRALFVDCGAYDGCSAVQFLLSEPDFEAVSFEPNPALWPHFDGLPTRLMRTVAYTFDGEIDFTIDPTDGDGSTLVKGKTIDFYGTINDADCPVIRVPCIDLSAFLREAAETYDRIVLKLDVEGAEYDILEKLLEDGTIRHVDRLYCEFHSHKMQLELGRHDRVVKEIGKLVPVHEWDALPLSMSTNNSTKFRLRRRAQLVEAIQTNRRRLADSAVFSR